MEMRAGREAGRSVIAEHLPALDAMARPYGDAAHMAVTGAEALAVIELHIIAETAVTPGDRHDAVGHRIDGGAIAAADIHAAVPTLVTKDRVAAHPVVRSEASARRPRHAAALFADELGTASCGK